MADLDFDKLAALAMRSGHTTILALVQRLREAEAKLAAAEKVVEASKAVAATWGIEEEPGYSPLVTCVYCKPGPLVCHHATASGSLSLIRAITAYREEHK